MMNLMRMYNLGSGGEGNWFARLSRNRIAEVEELLFKTISSEYG